MFPYKLMTEEQKAFLREFVTMAEVSLTGAVAATQIGGGCFLASSDKKPTHVDPVAVLGAFCQAVGESKIHTDPAIQRGLCCIVVQRVCGIVHLDRSTLQKVGEFMPKAQAGAEI